MIVRSGNYIDYIKLLILSVLLCLFGCLPTNKIATTYITLIYDKDAKFIDFDYAAFQDSDSTTMLYYSVNSSNLLYSKELNKKVFSAIYSIKYELFEQENLKIPIDSFTFKFIDSLNYNKNIDIIDSFKIKTVLLKNYSLLLSVYDAHRFQKYNYIVNINKTDKNSRQNFIIRNEKGLPVLKTYLSKNKEYKILSNNCKAGKLFVSYYKRNFPVALPPFSEARDEIFTNIPDSIFSIPAISGECIPFKIASNGFFHFRTDSSQKEGMTLYNFYDEFPEIRNPLHMLAPLKYITTKPEFIGLAEEKNTKEAIDNFWIDKAGNSDRAKELIKRFYNRVRLANLLFTSYIEGWKTDRGMIYIVFGPPNLVYRSAIVETWIYGEENNILSLSFNFNKVENPFTENDYGLVREAGYKDAWYAAIETWRK